MKLSIKIRKEDLSFLQRGKNFENTFNGVLIKAAKGVGKEIVKAMKEKMTSNGYEPNAADYVEWKANHGYDTRPLFRTHLLYNSIASETKINLPNSIGGEVGWHPGARYPGKLGNRQWARAVPKRRKKAMGEPDRDIGAKAGVDTNFLAEVAKWNNDGSGARYGSKSYTFTSKNGLTKKGTQKYRTRTRQKPVLLRSGRHARPFVYDIREESADIAFIAFKEATSKALSRIYYMSKYWQGRLKPMDDVPF